jgi:hypothetical protein
LAALSRSGSDDDVLNHAIRAADALPVETTPETRALIAERLRDLGFPDQAALWLQPGTVSRDHAAATDPADHPETAAVETDIGDEHARIAARDWGALASGGSPPWQGAARHLVAASAAAPDLPPLAKATALLDAAAALRGDMTTLLSAVPLPDAAKPGVSP